MNHDVLEDDMRDLLFSTWSQYKEKKKKEPRPYRNRNPYTPNDAEVLQATETNGVWAVQL